VRRDGLCSAGIESTAVFIALIVWSPLAQGVLTGKYSSGSVLPPGSRAADAEASAYIGRWMRPEVLAAVERLGSLAAGIGASLAQLSLAWVLSRPGVSSAIIGASRPDQIVENAKAIEIALDDELCAAIDAALSDVIQYARSER
jgi:aryl-alcohol dehydrogenase-like predicted oxidoreductase